MVTIHPFDDGNGRLARAIMDMLLARSDNSKIRFYSMSNQILKEHKRCNEIIEKTQKAAGYYVYCWAEALDADAFDAFKQSGDIFNPELAAKFHKHILTECGDGEGIDQYRKFRG
ncbi:Fic family protein [Bacteroidales bacterium OttesenSCG-928-J16]|nr:Fic family protein [Bacteroidales bacterium OttesenSCG-928-J16]